MRARIVNLAVSVLCLGLLCGPARAETWVRVVDNPGGNTTYVDVDVDSIHKDSDGLVYYTQADDWDIETDAFDCQKRLKYSVDHWKGLGKDWREYPLEIGGITVEVADYVCGRAG